MASEITEEEEDEYSQKHKIRNIIHYQKSLYLSSSSSSSSISSASASCSSFPSSRKTSNLLDLMKEGNTSLRRLFDMEHTSLVTHLTDYSGSPAIKPIPLWGSETEDEEIHDDPWKNVSRVGSVFDYGSENRSVFASGGSFVDGDRSSNRNSKSVGGRRKLSRTTSFRSLPRFRKWRCKGFRCIRLRIMICGRKY